MAFGSENLPLGPNGQFPKQRINSYGNEIVPPEDMEQTYLSCGLAKLPVVEKDYHSSVSKVKDRMKQGKPHKHSDEYRDIDRFRPRYAPPSSLRHALGEDEQKEIDELNTLGGGRSMKRMMKTGKYERRGY